MSTWQGVIQKIDDWRFRIPKSFKEGMRTDAVIYADEEMIDHIFSENAHMQAANVACLPGIVGNSLAMPDIHFGYGFPIGGVAAFDPENGGIISPGGVGYDINCLSPDSLILSEFGFTKKIKDFEDNWRSERVKCMKLNPGVPHEAGLARFIKIRPAKKVYEVFTESGKRITATEDHPFYTPQGMTPLKEVNGAVSVYPFEGVPFEKPKKGVLVRKKALTDFLVKLKKDSRGHGLEQILSHLEDTGLLPLRFNSTRLPYILKIMGFVFGDGAMYFQGGRKKGIIWFYGKPSDLEKIRIDVERIGFKPSRIYCRKRSHLIRTKYGEYRFDREESSFKVVSSSFAALLAILGVPLGNKAAQDYSLPKWLFKVPLWQKRLFLAALFGAEMSSPATMKGHDYSFYSPELTMNKREGFVKSGETFLRGISKLLSAFGVRSKYLGSRKEQLNKDGSRSFRLRLMAQGDSGNLIRLWGMAGIEYNADKSWLANVACHYLKLKEVVLRVRGLAEESSLLLKKEGFRGRYIIDLLKSKFANARFIERSLYGRKTLPRIAYKFPSFKAFLRSATKGLGRSGMVWDEVVFKQEINKPGHVYDFTVNDENHNFIANNFVVSNCGVRVLKTNLTHDDIKEKIKDLVYRIASEVPSGVGKEGPVSLSKKEMEDVLVNGAKWAVKNGYGDKEDIEHTEEEGAMPGADPYKVSAHAKERGTRQLGTVGSGNHFLEIQRVDEIYDERAALSFGLHIGQITIMIHSGSRGLGHQVCTDYISVMDRAVQKYGIHLPDRQLCCAPIDSEEGRDYFGAMAAAANFAWANRQMLMHWTIDCISKILGKSRSAMGIELIYDVAHNIAKMERHKVNGKEKLLCVHRKGATRAFPAGRAEVPSDYREIGQPVLIPGDMGRYSYILVGTDRAMEETWGSVCHGAGRLMSRSQAARQFTVEELTADLEGQGIIVRSASRKGLLEEAPGAYKDVREVVNVVHNAGLAKKVARMRPLGVVKG
jgi:tRNA-splicing ligase RtcB